jgi:hypothetical protein
MSASPLRLSTFTPLVGDTFSVEHPPSHVVELRLTRITPAGRPRPKGPEGEPEDAFNLYFVGPDTQPIPQATYLFAHSAIGRHAIFIVPVGREDGGLLYEAVFN